MIEQSTVQRAAITHRSGPLLILAGAGTGKTYALVERFAWLVEQGVPADAILALTFSPTAADDLRERIERRVPAGYEELSVTTFQAFCARLLRQEALEAGVDPFAAPVTASDRLALLLERIDELPLASHDLRGNPSALLGSIVQRIDRLKDELVTAADYEAWAAKLPGEGGTATREREFAAIYAAHDRMLAEAGTLDFGDLVLHAFRLLRSKPHVRARLAARFRHVLVDELQDTNFAQGLLLRLLVAEHGNVTAAADEDQSIHRFRGAATKAVADFRAEWPDATVVRLRESFRSGERIIAAARAVVETEKPLVARAGADPRRRRVLALRVRARAGAGRRRRGRAPRRAPGRRAGGDLRARALREDGRPGGRGGARGARGAVPADRRRGVLPARRGARPAGVAAAAGRPGRRRRGRTRARPPADRAACDRPRPLHPDRPPPQARHGRGARRRARVAADPARGARADRRVPEALPLARGDARLDAPGPLRAPADRAARPPPPAAVRRLDRGGRAARQPGQVRRARGRLPAPLAAGDRARVRPLDRRRRRRRAARGGGGRRRAAARRAGDGDARRQGTRVRPRLRARPDGRAHARPAPARARADPGRADQGGAAARLQGGPCRRRCGG